jgi:hypothetical protein
MPWTALAIFLPLLQFQDDIDFLRRLLEGAALTRDDEPLLKELTERVARTRDAVTLDPGEAARVLRTLIDPKALETPWTPDDPALRAGLAWIAGHRGTGKAWTATLRKWVWDPDPRAGFSAARALHRLLDGPESAKFEEEYFRRGFGPWEPGEEILRGHWIQTVRGRAPYAPFPFRLLDLAPDLSLILFLHLLPEDGFRSFAAFDHPHPWYSDSCHPILMRRLYSAADRFDALPEAARDRFLDVVARVGSPDALFPLLRRPSQDLRDRAKAAIGLLGAGSVVWLPRWVELLEQETLDPDLSRWAHQTQKTWNDLDAEFVDRTTSARLYRELLRKNGQAIAARHLDRAVSRGIDFLRKTAAPGRESALTPFALFALLRAGVPVDDPVIQKGFQALLQNPGAPHGAGPLACAQYGIRAASSKNRSILPRSRVLDRLREGLQKLETPGWGCGPEGSSTACHGCTHLAVLTLAEAAEAGIRVRPSVWERAVSSLQKIEGPHGSSCMIVDALALQLALRAAPPHDTGKNPPARVLEWAKASLEAGGSLENALFPPEGPLGREGPWGYSWTWNRGGGSGARGVHWHGGYGSLPSSRFRLYALQRLGLIPDLDSARLLVMMRQTPSGAWIDGGSAIASTAAALLFLRDTPPVPTVDSRPARPVPDRYEKAAARIRLPDAKARKTWAGKSEHHRRVVETLSDPANWAWALQAIEDRLGLFFPEGEVEVVFEELEERRPARGGGRDGKGIVKFNLRRLAEYAREVEQARKRETGIAIWVVPPVTLESMITHELAHVSTGPCEEKWLAEGLASFAAGDTAFLFAFNDRGGRVEPLDRPVAEEDGYARGWAFLEWLREKHGAEKVRELAGFVRNEGAALAEAAPAVTGKTWAEVVKEEHAWSREFLSRFKPSR